MIIVNKERIIEILKETKVLLEGHFLLTSGKHSAKYMQCAKLLQYPVYTEEIARHLANKFNNEKIDSVIAPAVGGIIFGYEVARQLGAKNLFAERVNGKMELRRGFEIPKGAKVLVAEDVVTTGGSVKEVIEAVKKQGGEVVGVVVVVDRSNGTVKFGAKFEAALTTEIIAYGADDCPLCKEGNSVPVKHGSRKI